MLYQNLADRLQSLIHEKVYEVGSRLPGVRQLSQQHEVSVSTAVSACRELEQRGLLEARPRAGYFVRQPPALRDAPRPGTASQKPRVITGQSRVLTLVQAVNNPDVVNLGAAVPNADYLPVAIVERAYRHVLRTQRRRCMGYEFPPGAPELRQQIARRMAGYQCKVTADEVLVTNSCQEAIAIALKLLTQPGDTVALESPTYYGLLQVVESLGLKALEIPTDPVHGVSIEALELALERWPVAACVLVTNFSNPLGVCMTDQRKQALLKCLYKYQVPLVEDDIYGDLPFNGRRPSPVKRWDTQGLVYYCSSVSKTLSAGMRTGWLIPGAQHEKARHLQFVSTVSVNTPAQLALAHFLQHGHYERCLRQSASDYARAVARMIDRVTQLFPADTRVSRPAGGFVLWVELPEAVNTLSLMEQALDVGVSFAPGELFSASGKFSNCMRLNCAVRWDARLERALIALSRLL
ncbi:MAG: PLP-dependent aminotransferase family protein [Pseudohongiella sp.]|uniref:PLP-dependent aminotransferase family protein n=1 Tax=Pseudohongiella sp. TaxID=1979412 RepID=UPI0034A040AB